MRSSSRDPGLTDRYGQYLKDWARARLGPVVASATIEGWENRLRPMRGRLALSLGRVPDVPCELEPDVLGVLKRPGYVIERLTFQSRPGVRVTANLYRPEPLRDRAPGVLSVHGHWSWARMDPHVQPRCLGLAKLGYVVLCVDAFGAGERAVEPGPGTYHGASLGASLWPVGTPLIGLQVYDNRRAVDYLISRPEVDAARLAITGASGGGNQSLYAGATDDRLAAVVPVCGVGTYDAYLSTACCVCEVNSGGASYTTTGDLLAMIAPRALLVISATRDAHQFSVAEAARSVAHARERYRLLNQAEKIRHTAIESGHDYNQPMREAMYGWLEKWLRQKGDGSPVREPEVTIEEVDALRCFAAGTPRPKSIVTIPEWARREGMVRLASLPKAPDHVERWNADAETMRTRLRDEVLGGFPKRSPLESRSSGSGDQTTITIAPEPGMTSEGVLTRPRRPSVGTAIVVGYEFDAQLQASPGGLQRALDDAREEWVRAGFNVLETRCRSLPVLGGIAGALDHTVAEWGLWAGRPLLGQWVWDLICWLDHLDDRRSRTRPGNANEITPGRPFILVGLGAMALPTLVAAGLDRRIAGIACLHGLVSLVGTTDIPWRNVPMGLLAPGLLEVGDIGHLAALVAPRPLVYANAIEPDGGHEAAAARSESAFRFARSIFRLMAVPDKMALARPANLPAMMIQS